MPYHFRTIEDFVQLLEARRDRCFALMAEQSDLELRGYCEGRGKSFQVVLDILRTSNIGIVYPPPEQKRDLPDLEPGEAYCPCCNGTGLAGERESCQVCGGSGTLGALSFEPNGTRCPDCGLPCDPATGVHTCSDGQVRGFRV
jgi:hypothetical protein